MNVLLDDIALPGPSPSIAAALDLARLKAQESGRVVVEAVLDGVPLTDQALRNPPDSPSPARELRFLSADATELVASTFRGVSEMLTDIRAEQTAAAEMLTVGRMGDAMDRMQAALGAWNTVHRAISDGTALLGLSPDALSVPTDKGERSVGDLVRSLATCLSEVKRAFAAQDWSGLADVLGYDLSEQADGWQKALVGLADRVSRTRAAPVR